MDKDVHFKIAIMRINDLIDHLEDIVVDPPAGSHRAFPYPEFRQRIYDLKHMRDDMLSDWSLHAAR